MPCACGLEGEDGVVDAAELSGGDEDEWPALLCGVVGGEGEFGVERDGQSAGALDEDEFVSAGEFVGAAGDEGEVESSVLESSGEVGGGGEAEDLWCGESLFVLGEASSHHVAVCVEVFGEAVVAGLDHLHGDDVASVAEELCGDGAGGDGLADAGVDA